MLRAFINLSGPTREPQKVSVLINDPFSITLLRIQLKPTTQPGWGVGCEQNSAWRL